VFSLKLERVFLPCLVSTNTELRVEVRSLAGQDRIVIEIGRLILEVPFADHGGVVTGFAELDGEGLLAWRNAPGEVKGVVIVIILPGKNAGARGRADRIGAKGIFKKCSFLGEPVDGWGWSDLSEAAPVSRDPMGGVIVRHDEEDVGTGVVTAVMIG